MKTRLGNIGHDAHFGGAVGGFCLTLIVAPWVLENQLWVVLLLVLGLVYMWTKQSLRARHVQLRGLSIGIAQVLLPNIFTYQCGSELCIRRIF